MATTKYGKYVSREIIAESKYPEISTPIAKYQGCRGGGNAVSCEWSCITKPFTMDQEPEVDYERDQFLLFGGANLEDGKEFSAEIELPIGPRLEKQTITSPTCVYLPKGMKHGPVKFKSVGKPIVCLSSYLSPEYSVSWTPDSVSKCVAEIGDPPFEFSINNDGPPDVSAIHPPDIPFRYLRQPMGKGLNYFMWSSGLGFPAKVSWSYGTVWYRDFFYLEPVHAHRHSHQISMYLGGNPLDIEDFDAEIDIWMGKEREKHTINTCAVDHYVPGIPHLGDEIRRVGKPFIHVMWVIGPNMNNYYEAAPVDKVLLSDESKGEVMIPTGAKDYVPPTPIDEWVWPYPQENE
jgi:hypothetical protein